MRAFQRSAGQIFAINAQFCGALLNGLLAWYWWPSSPEWWGFAVLSILTASAAVAFFINGLRGMTALYLRDWTLADYQAQAKPQKNADMAADDALRDAGVIDD